MSTGPSRVLSPTAVPVTSSNANANSAQQAILFNRMILTTFGSGRGSYEIASAVRSVLPVRDEPRTSRKPRRDLGDGCRAVAEAFEDAKTLLAEGSSVVVTNIAGARFVSRYDARIVERQRLEA